MVLLFETTYRVSNGQPLDESNLNLRYQSIDLRLGALEDVGVGLAAVQRDLRNRGTVIINDAALPIIAELDALGAEKLEQAETSLATIQGLETQIQAIYDDLDLGQTFTGNLTVTGNITAANLSGTNTGNEGQATGLLYGTVRLENGATTAIVYSRTFVDNLNANLQASIGTVAADLATLDAEVQSLQGGGGGSLQSQIDDLGARATSAESRLDAAEAQLTSLASSLATLQSTVTGHTGSIGNLNSQVATITTDVTSLGDRVTALEGVANAASIFFITIASPTAQDQAVKTRLEADGHTVTYHDVAAGGHVAASSGSDLVVISPAPLSGDVGNVFRGEAIPVLLLEHRLIDDMGLATSDNDTPGTQIDILTSHPIVDGLSGTETVFSSSVDIGYGTPIAAATLIASIAGNAAQSAIFTVPSGGSLNGGGNAAEVRTFIGFIDESAAINSTGLDIIANAVNWMLA